MGAGWRLNWETNEGKRMEMRASERANERTNEKNIQHKPKKNAIGIFVAWSSETKEREKKEEVEHWTNEEMKWNARKWSVWQLLKARLQQLMLVVAPNQRVYVLNDTTLSLNIVYYVVGGPRVPSSFLTTLNQEYRR